MNERTYTLTIRKGGAIVNTIENVSELEVLRAYYKYASKRMKIKRMCAYTKPYTSESMQDIVSELKLYFDDVAFKGTYEYRVNA